MFKEIISIILGYFIVHQFMKTCPQFHVIHV